MNGTVLDGARQPLSLSNAPGRSGGLKMKILRWILEKPAHAIVSAVTLFGIAALIGLLTA
jgi:hypothetical protein